MSSDATPEPAAPELTADKRGNWTYASPAILARVVVGLLVVLIVIDLIAIVALQARVNLVRQLTNAVLPTEAQMVSADDHVSYAFDAWLACLLATMGIFIWWFQRTYGNLSVLGASDLRYTHGWSMGAWFVPFLNLVRPVQIANET